LQHKPLQVSNVKKLSFNKKKTLSRERTCK
jgi:hypothetical protein